MSASDACSSGWALTGQLLAHHFIASLLIGWGWLGCSLPDYAERERALEGWWATEWGQCPYESDSRELFCPFCKKMATYEMGLTRR